MHEIRIDLYSDVVTKPTPEMREYMSKAEVGDEKGGEDPTVNRLNEMVAELLGKEAAIFLPSGTMCNIIAVRSFCRPGDEILLDHTAHSLLFETGGPAALSGAMLHPIVGQRGIFTGHDVDEAVQPDDPHCPRTSLVWVEQTANIAGGTIWPLSTIQDVCAAARKHGLACHMDGARLMNAVVAMGTSAADYSAGFDSVWLDYSKGLGAPVGAGLAGSKAFIEEATRLKFQFGGAMRQAGIIAAGAIYALEHNIDRLAEDHANAELLCRGLCEIDGLTVEPAETNMVFFDVAGIGTTSHEFNDALLSHGMRVSIIGRTRARAVTHLDVNREQIEEALEIIRNVVSRLQAQHA